MIHTTITDESIQIENGMARISTTINLRQEVYEFLDQCFAMIGYSWEDFFQAQIEDCIESLRDGSSEWLGRAVQKKLKEI